MFTNDGLSFCLHFSDGTYCVRGVMEFGFVELFYSFLEMFFNIPHFSFESSESFFHHNGEEFFVVAEFPIFFEFGIEFLIVLEFAPFGEMLICEVSLVCFRVFVEDELSVMFEVFIVFVHEGVLFVAVGVIEECCDFLGCGIGAVVIDDGFCVIIFFSVELGIVFVVFL